MRIAVPVDIDMTGGQLEAYAAEHGLPKPLRARDAAADAYVRVLAAVRDSAAFGGTGDGQDSRRAAVSTSRGPGGSDTRIAVIVVIEMTGGQLAGYAAEHGLPEPLRAKDVVGDVNPRVLAAVRDSAAFGGTSDGQDNGQDSRRAAVSLRRRP